MNRCKINLDIQVVEELFMYTRACKTIAPCSTFILELKHSMEIYMAERLLQQKFISLRTGMNHCLTEMLSEDMIVDETSWTGGGY